MSRTTDQEMLEMEDEVALAKYEEQQRSIDEIREQQRRTNARLDRLESIVLPGAPLGSGGAHRRDN